MMRAIYLGLLVAIAGVVLALAFLSASPQTHPSQTVYLNSPERVYGASQPIQLHADPLEQARGPEHNSDIGRDNK